MADKLPDRMYISPHNSGAVGGNWHNASTIPIRGLVKYIRASMMLVLDSDEITALRAENERLRKALDEIACNHHSRNLLWWQMAARAALSETET
jgi:hypothetical protein